MEMLRYADELKEADQFFDEVPTGKPDKEMVDLAVELIERKAGKFTPDQFEDHYATALRELVQKKLRATRSRLRTRRRHRAAPRSSISCRR